ncbi:hypothetical protein SDC9_126621 [bioreactor metagenome]|uniref:Uncharacterized protein n=1 Tax=bioreactor metagenome TaxID=1076179 RepID=A0A645CSA7_9ZZZZ
MSPQPGLRLSEAVANAHADQNRVHLERTDLVASRVHVGADVYLLHVEVDRPVLVDGVVKAHLQGAAPAVLLDGRRQCCVHSRVELHSREAGVVDTDTDVGLECAEVGEVVLTQQCGRQVLERTDLVATSAQVMLLRVGQDQLGSEVGREEVGHVNFRDPLVVDRQIQTGGVVVAAVQIDSAHANHERANRISGLSDSRAGSECADCCDGQ